MLSDCTAKNPAEAEIFIVGRQSLATMAKSVRNRMTQAVLPIGDGILEMEGADLEDVLDDEDGKGIVAALGVGICLSEEKEESETFDLKLLRYDKIIVVVDNSSGGRFVQAPVIAFLCSDGARWINGANIAADGGLEAAVNAQVLGF